MQYNEKILDFWKKHGLKYIKPNNSGEFPEGWDIRDYLISKIENETVAEIGCGYGRLCGKFKPEQYTGYDINPSAIEKAKSLYPKYNFQQYSLSNIPRADWVFCYTVLLHISDDDIQNFVNLLAINSDKIIIGEIMGKKYRNNSMKPPVFNREAIDYIRIFANAGFQCVGKENKPYEKYGKDTQVTFLEFKKAKSTDDIKFVCVCKPSAVYTTKYIDKLIEGFESNNTQNVNAYCISTEDYNNPRKIPMLYNWNGWWSKMEIFRPDINGNILYLDLDSIIRKNIDNIIDICRSTDKPIMLRDFMKKRQLASGMMWLPEKYRKEVWDKWILDPNKWMKKHKKVGDQAFIREVLKSNCLRWQDILEDNTVASLKIHCRKTTPDNTSVICYHGRPRPHEINWSQVFIPRWWEKK
jgi:SAM-dependent methyltransferase